MKTGNICTICGEEVISGKADHLRKHGISAEDRTRPYKAQVYFQGPDGW